MILFNCGVKFGDTIEVRFKEALSIQMYILFQFNIKFFFVCVFFSRVVWSKIHSLFFLNK
jgi:hypothetical protein